MRKKVTKLKYLNKLGTNHCSFKYSREKCIYIRIALWMSMRRLKVYEKGIFETEKKNN